MRFSMWVLVLVLGLTGISPAQSPADQTVLKLNSEMMQLYATALKHAEADLLREHPVILALFTGQGGQMILYRNGQPPLTAPRVPIRYELMKSVSHSSMAIFAHAYSHLGEPAEAWKGPLANYLATSKAALAAVGQTDMPEPWRQNLREVLNRNIAFMERTLKAGSITREELDRYATDLKPFLQKNIAWAAQTQVGHWMGVIEDWKKLIGPDWDKAIGASNTIYVTRQNNILYFVLAQYFGKSALNDRLFLFETTAFTTDPAHMLSLTARVVADRSVGEAFFGDYYLMDYELMGSDARKAIEAECKARNLEVNLPPLVPFHSWEWPMRHDPSQGQGPAQLQDLP